MEKERINVRCANCGKRMHTLNDMRRHEKECPEYDSMENDGVENIKPSSPQDISQDQIQCRFELI